MIEIKATFENYFGEDLIKVTIFRNMLFGTINDIKDKEEKIDILTFYASEREDDHWYLQFSTASGEYWQNESPIRCNAREKDNYKIILGVNGQSKRVYAAFSNSRSCSAALNRI